MPTLTLTFQLPEERVECLLAQRGVDYLCVLHELDRWLHSKMDAESDEVRIDTYHAVFIALHDACDAHGIDLTEEA